VLRRRIEVPATLNGYSLRGTRIRLDLAVDSNDSVMITVFSNGAMVSRTDADTLQPIVLTENAQPGDTFLVAMRIQAAENSTKISASRLLITPPATRPDPGIFRQEILAVQTDCGRISGRTGGARSDSGSGGEIGGLKRA